MSFLTARLHISTRNSLPANAFVFSDSTMAHQHLEFVTGQRVCVSFLTARLYISIRNSLHANVFVFFDSTIAHQHSEFAARHRAGRVCRYDGTSAFVSRCPASCLFFLTARWRTLAQRQPITLVRCCCEKTSCCDAVRQTRRRDG